MIAIDQAARHRRSLREQCACPEPTASSGLMRSEEIDGESKSLLAD
ncbi:MAG: hypothetical protein ACRCWS_06080 [Propionibacteriaceae bacterium]